MRKYFGIALVVLAVGIAVLPHYTTCQYEGKVLTLQNGKTTFMKCTWTAQAEIAVAVPLGIVGIMAFMSRKRSNMIPLYSIAAALGIMALLVPTKIIGVCSTGMPCHTIMQPSLVGMGGVVGLASVVGLAFSIKNKEWKL